MVCTTITISSGTMDFTSEGYWIYYDGSWKGITDCTNSYVFSKRIGISVGVKVTGTVNRAKITLNYEKNNVSVATEYYHIEISSSDTVISLSNPSTKYYEVATYSDIVLTITEVYEA